MSSDNPQNPEQPGEFDDLASHQPEPTKPDQSPQPEDKVDPPKIREEETKSPQEQLEQLRKKERENQDKVIELLEKNAELQKKLATAEKLHEARQKNTVEMASKTASLTKRIAKERDHERKSKKIYMVVMVAAVILLCVFATHDLSESAPSPTKPAAQEAATNGTKSQYDFSDHDFTAELKALRIEPEKTGTEKKK